MQNKWYKNKETDLIWWKETDKIGVWEFSFDKNKVFNMFRDYPHELSDYEKDIFDRENPYWKDFFNEREIAHL